MSLITFSTNQVAQTNQFEYWNDVVCNVFIGLECCNLNDSVLYSGSISYLDLASIEMSLVECEPSDVQRKLAHISKSNNDVFMLHLQLEGTSIQRQNEHECLLNPGDLAICQSSIPYSLSFDGPIKMLVVKVPITQVQNHIVHPELLAGLKVTRTEGIGDLLVSHLKQLWNLREHLDALVYQTAIGDTVSSILAMTMQQAYPSLFCESKRPIREAQIIRLRNYIAKNLSNPNLSPTMIAEANGISRRYMRKIFNADGITCQKLIVSRRIDAIADELKRNERSNVNISELAYKWGFNNMSHFSRAFRNNLGVSAKEFREQHNRRALKIN